MKHQRFLSLLLTLVILCSFLGLHASASQTDLQLQCNNAILMDGNYGDVLYEQAAYEKAYPASMTKVMTALLTLEAIEAGTVSENTVVTVSENASRKDFADESTANLLPGEQMSVKNLLYCLMLPSANDAAKALAEHLGGSISSFADSMNRRAAELGCKNTHFINPNGLHDPNHYTCAYDIALIFLEALEHDLFRQIIATTDYSAPATNLSGERYFYNTNGLISNLYYNGYVYDKCIGGKTGSTVEAGRCLVAAARDGDRLMVSVVMGAGPITMADGSQRQGQLDESRRLLEYGFLNFHRITLAPPDEAVATVAVTLSEDGQSVGVKARGSISAILPNSVSDDAIQSEILLHADTVQAPVKEGQVLGSMRYFCEDRELGELELVAERDMEYSKKLYRKQKFQTFMDTTGKKILVGLVILLLLPVTALIAIRIINVQRRKRRRKRAAQRRAAQRGRANRQ